MEHAEDYRWSSYLAHGLGELDPLVDGLIAYEELSPYPKVRRRRWAAKVHEPLKEDTLRALRRSTGTGLPYGSPTWVEHLGEQLGLDLTIRPAAARERGTDHHKHF